VRQLECYVSIEGKISTYFVVYRLLRRIVRWMGTIVSEDGAASIFRVEIYFTHHAKWRNNPENHELYLYRREKLKYR